MHEEVLTSSQIIISLVSGGFLAVLFGILGVYTVQRGLSFWGDGIAHASLAGIAVALLTGWQPLILAIIVALIFAVSIFYLEEKTTLKKDALIGILFTALMSIGLLLASGLEEGHHELEAFLFGDLHEVNSFDSIVIVAMSVLILGLVYKYRKAISYISVDPQGAYLAGINVRLMNLMFYCMLAVSVVLAAKVMGVILVSALLIIPASAAQVISSSAQSWKKLSLIFSIFTVIVGLGISLVADIPSGPTIILLGTLIFIFTVFFKKS